SFIGFVVIFAVAVAIAGVISIRPVFRFTGIRVIRFSRVIILTIAVIGSVRVRLAIIGRVVTIAAVTGIAGILRILAVTIVRIVFLLVFEQFNDPSRQGDNAFGGVAVANLTHQRSQLRLRSTREHFIEAFACLGR